MIIKKKPQPQAVQSTAASPSVSNLKPGDVDLFNLDSIDFKQRQERRRGDRRRGFRRIDDRNLISRAREEAQAIKEAAAKEGYEEGLVRAQEDLVGIKSSLGRFLNAPQEVFDSIAPSLLDIGMDIAKKIIKSEITQNPEIIMNNITAILKGLPKEEAKITIKVNPAQAALIKTQVPDVMEAAGLDAKMYIVPDETIMEGGCVVMTTNGVIDATLETQLAVITEALKEVS